MPEVASLALYGAAASRAAVVALIGAVSAVSRFGVIAFAAMARVCGCRVGRAVVVQRLQWTGMTGVCRWVDIRTGTDDMAAVCAGGVAGVALTVADLLLRIEHRGAAAVVTACIDRLKEETAAAGGTHGAELWDRAAPLKGGAVGHQLEQGLRLIGIPISSNRYDVILIVFAAILHLPADGFLTGSLLGIKPDLVAWLDDHTGCPAIFHRHKGGVLCPIAAAVDRGLTLDAPRLAVDDDGTATDVATDLAHALGVKFMVGGIQLFIVTIAAGVPVLRSVSRPAGGGYVGMSGAGMLRLQMILKIRVAEAPVVMIAAHSAYGISAAVLAALIAAVLAGIAVVEAQAAVLTEVIRIVRVHCTHSLGAVGVALAALLAHLAGFAELVLVLFIRDPAVTALADVFVPLGAFHAGLAVWAAAALGVISAALQAQAAVLAGLLIQQAFLTLFAGRVAIDAVDDTGIIVVHALVHRTEAGVTQRAVHRVAVIVCAVIAESAGVADGYGAAWTLMAFAAQLVILADVAFAAGGAVRVLHAVRAFIALLAPVGRVAQAQTAVVAMGFNPAIVVAVNGAELAVAQILTPVVVVAVGAISAGVVVIPKGVGGKL